MRGVVPEALASHKLVFREECSEGSGTANSGTDEQKPDMRLLNEDKQAHHCNVRRIQDRFTVDQAGIGGSPPDRTGREKALTRGYLDNHGLG